MKKKVGIITFHFVCNCGAVLQCQAMQHTLEKMGYDVEVIDYRPRYLTDQYAEWSSLKREFRIIRVRYGVDTIKNRMHAYLSIPVWYKKNRKGQRQFRKERLEAFNRYIDKNLNLTKRIEEAGELTPITEKYDAIICGSDQIWNWLITDGSYDQAYFLSFARTGQKAIAYAVSCGVYPDAKHMQEFLKSINRLDAISFREKSVSDMLRMKENISSEVVVDPTLLLGKEMWRLYETEVFDVNEPYLLVYCLEPTEMFTQVVNQVREKLCLRIVNISPSETSFEEEIIHNRKCSPGEFLFLIDNAQFVVSNSFHAVVFSLIFEKKFACVPHSKTGNRMVDILKSVDLFNRIINTDRIEEQIFDNIDYLEIGQKIAQQAEQSMEYLIASLGE